MEIPKGHREAYNDEQRLVEILVQMVLASTADPVFCAKPIEEKAEWISKTLRECGYENTPLGANWVYLTSVKPR